MRTGRVIATFNVIEGQNCRRHLKQLQRKEKAMKKKPTTVQVAVVPFTIASRRVSSINSNPDHRSHLIQAPANSMITRHFLKHFIPKPSCHHPIAGEFKSLPSSSSMDVELKLAQALTVENVQHPRSTCAHRKDLDRD
jgi:hypothetical protein